MITVGVVVLVLAVAVALPGGRRLFGVLFGAVLRWPSLIRAELRGAAPLQNGRPGADGPDGRVDTTPDIPVVTRGLPVVERRGPAGGGSR